MITFDKFIEKYDGKFCEMGGSSNALNQCVDLANGYIKEVLEQPIILGTNAQQFPDKCGPNYEYILNTIEAIPKKGDIIIWKSPDNIGHIAICISAGTNDFISFDQNWPLKSPCKKVTHTYKSGNYTVLGWLRFKTNQVINQEENMTNEEIIMLDFIKVNKITEGQLREGYSYVKDGTVAKQSKEIVDLKKSIDGLGNRLNDLEVKLSLNEKSIEDYQAQLQTANELIQKLSVDIDYYKPYKNLYETKLKETVDKYSAWELIKMGLKKLQINKTK